jgi:hypothetical protein
MGFYPICGVCRGNSIENRCSSAGNKGRFLTPPTEIRGFMGGAIEIEPKCTKMG